MSRTLSIPFGERHEAGGVETVLLSPLVVREDEALSAETVRCETAKSPELKLDGGRFTAFVAGSRVFDRIAAMDLPGLVEMFWVPSMTVTAR